MRIRNTSLTSDQVTRLQNKLGQGTIITLKGDVVMDIFTLEDKVVVVTVKGTVTVTLALV